MNTDKKEQIKQFNNLNICIESLFIFIIKLKRYDYELYKILKEKIIIEILEDKELIKVNDLNLNFEVLEKFYKWYLHLNYLFE